MLTSEIDEDDTDVPVASPFNARNAESIKNQTNYSRKLVRNILDKSIGNESILRKSAVGNFIKDNQFESSLNNTTLSNRSLNFQLDATHHLLEPETPTSYKQNIFNSINCIPESETGSLATTNLYSDFNQCMLTSNNVEDALDLLKGYKKCCLRQEQLLTQIKCKTGSDVQYESIDDMCGLLKNERRTWLLLACLYEDKIQEDILNASLASKMEDDAEFVNESEQKVIDAFFKDNHEIRRSQNVVDWLETNAASEIKMTEERMRFFHDNVFWENTLHQLKQNKMKGIDNSAETTTVTEMDPDAPGRQKRTLINLDKNDEVILLKHVFAFIRSGKIKEAQDLCISCGQAWRSASLEGWKLFCDPNKMSNYDKSIGNISGNPMRDLWKATAWRMSSDETLNSHERAIYGTFCGNLKSILCGCLNWEDYVWAYFKVKVDVSVERELYDTTTLKKKCLTQAGSKITKIPSAYWEQLNSVETAAKVFETIQAASNDVVQQECNELFHLIQKFIIIEDMTSIVDTAHMWVNPDLMNADDVGHVQPQVLRFLVHLILFLEKFGLTLDEDKCSSLIESYIKYLASSESTQGLVACYTASLSPDKQIEVYSDFLKSVSNRKSQEIFLELAYEAGLDVPSITKRIVEEIQEEGISPEYSLTFNEPENQTIEENLMFPSMDTEILPDDQRLINSLDWLVYDVSQRADAIKQCCCLMRSFLTASKFNATRAVFEKIPTDSIDIIYRESNAQGTAELPNDVKNCIREYFCMKAYLNAHQKFKEWFVHFYNKKPENKDTANDTAKGMKKFSRKIVKQNRDSTYIEELENWRQILNQLCNDVRDHIYNVLLFPEGGWLVDSELDNDDKREYELDVLRRMCIPTLCDLIVTALEKTGGRTNECLSLCSVITTNEYCLFKLFNKNTGRKLLKRIKDIAMDTL